MEKLGEGGTSTSWDILDDNIYRQTQQLFEEGILVG
jgi:hypothetical protein